MTRSDVTTPITQGGTQSKRVIVGLYPMVAAIVGKKSENDPPTSMKHAEIASHHTVQSVRASTSPDRCALFCLGAHTSSTILLWASICSSIVSHETGVVG